MTCCARSRRRQELDGVVGGLSQVSVRTARVPNPSGVGVSRRSIASIAASLVSERPRQGPNADGGTASREGVTRRGPPTDPPIFSI